MIDTVTLGGQPLDPCAVVAEVTVIHGRSGFGQGPTAGSATLRVEVPAGRMLTQGVGAVLLLDGPAGRMFAGRIADASLEHFTATDGTSWGLFTLTAVGPVAALGYRMVGDVPWEMELDSDRAAHILARAGVPWRVEPTPDFSESRIYVMARDVDAQPAGGLLEELASWTSAAVFDTPNGEVVYQSLPSRTRVAPLAWRDLEATWADFDPADIWDDFLGLVSPSSEFPLALPCDVVDFEPRWELSASDIVNHVRVGYGEALEGESQPEVELFDWASIDRYGLRYLNLSTGLEGFTDASRQASRIISTQARERWQMSEVTVALDLCEPGLHAAVLALQCGDQVIVQGLPQPAPAIDWPAIVEGWTFTQYGQGGQLYERITLALSDPMLSVVLPAWGALDPDIVWADIDPVWAWSELDWNLGIDVERQLWAA